MPTPFLQQTAGLYVHIPFCRQKCAYCDFFSITDHALVGPFIDALRDEAAMMLPEKSLAFDSIYIGGGTPSVLKEKQISEIIEFLICFAGICTDNEITIEVNPESAGREWLKAVHQAGVNRISIGIQSFNETALAFLGRIHAVRKAKETFETARAVGFDNISLDLIYGLPGQTMAELEADLAQAVALEPEHLSCYMLTVETGTPLDISLKKKSFCPLSESTLGNMFMSVADILTRRGYIHYEISNFTRRTEVCSRHNSKYWLRAPYVGLGPAAHSCFGAKRSWNVKNVSDYVGRLSSGQSPCLSEETLSVHQQMTETLYLGLRLTEGINLDDFNREFAIDFQNLFASVLSRYKETGMLNVSGNRCFLSTRGMLFHETIVGDLADLL